MYAHTGTYAYVGYIMYRVDTLLNKIIENIFPVKRFNSGRLDPIGFKCRFTDIHSLGFYRGVRYLTCIQHLGTQHVQSACAPHSV